MNIPMRWVGGLVLAALFAGCRKQETAAPVAEAPGAPRAETVALIGEAERSRHFLAVNRHLELGGTLYGFVDIDGDAQRLGRRLQDVLGEIAKAQPQAAPYLKQDVGALFEILGLTDVKAVGLSSVPDGTGYYRNRTFFYTPGPRHGLLAGLGGEPAPFERLHLAPADADVYSEGEIDLPAIYKTVLEVVAKVGGEESAGKMEQGLKLAGQKAAVSFLGLIQNWKGRTAMVMRIEEGPGIKVPGPNGLQLPAFSLLLAVDGIAPVLRETLVKLPMLALRQEGPRELFELKQPLPVAGLSPVLVIEGSTLMLASSPKFLHECLEAKGGLAQTAEFQQALAPFGGKGNGLGYVSPRLFRGLQSVRTLNPDLPAEPRRVLDLVLSRLPEIDRPLVTVRTNLPEGILIHSYWNQSLKEDLAAVSLYNPITIGLVAAMAIPAFQKVRLASQEKAVLNNLRQLAAAADQFQLENGRPPRGIDELVGPTKYVRRLNPVAGESYRDLRFGPGEVLRVQLPSGQVVQYPRP